VQDGSFTRKSGIDGQKVWRNINILFCSRVTAQQPHRQGKSFIATPEASSRVEKSMGYNTGPNFVGLTFDPVSMRMKFCSFRPVESEGGECGRMANGSQKQIPGLKQDGTMSLSDEQGQAIRNELKRFAGDMNLSDEQKTKLQERLTVAAGKLQEYKKSHPNVTRQDIIQAVGSQRAELRQGLERFLTPEQLKKWDAEVSKAKEFLGQPTA
jgi:hypothetical protein